MIADTPQRRLSAAYSLSTKKYETERDVASVSEVALL
jgi:hypothetical protein